MRSIVDHKVGAVHAQRKAEMQCFLVVVGEIAAPAFFFLGFCKKRKQDDPECQYIF